MRPGVPPPAPMSEQADDTFEWRGRRRPGRPRGSKNAYRVAPTVEVAVATQDDTTRVPDIADMIAAQLRIIGAVQAKLAAGGSVKDVADLSRALDTAVAAVARAAKSQDDILARMSQAQQVEAAVRRIEQQDAATVAVIVRRLKGRLQEIADTPEGPRTAVDAIKNL